MRYTYECHEGEECGHVVPVLAISGKTADGSVTLGSGGEWTSQDVILSATSNISEFTWYKDGTKINGYDSNNKMTVSINSGSEKIETYKISGTEEGETYTSNEFKVMINKKKPTISYILNDKTMKKY